MLAALVTFWCTMVMANPTTFSDLYVAQGGHLNVREYLEMFDRNAIEPPGICFAHRRPGRAPQDAALSLI